MRNPGRVLLRVVQSPGMTRFRETVVASAVADMQHECGEERSANRRAFVLLRGYWSIVAGSALYAALLPARHMRENWGARDAPGPRLLRQAWGPALVVAALVVGYVGIMTATSMDEEWRPKPAVLPLLAASLVVVVGHAALSVGIGWALARDRSGTKAALGIGLVLAAGSFLYIDLAIPPTSRAYREAAYWERTGRSTPLRRGSFDMSFSELNTTIAIAEANACARPVGACSCANGESLASLRTSWHLRLSIPAFGLSFVILATALSMTRRRLLVVLGLWLTYVGAILMRVSDLPAAVQGDVPVALAAWGPHVLPLGVAALAYFLTHSHPTKRLRATVA